MVKDHSDSQKGNLLPPHGLLFSINSKGSFICTAFVTQVMEHWLDTTTECVTQKHPESMPLKRVLQWRDITSSELRPAASF